MSYEYFTIVIQTTVGRKNLGNINVDVHEILRRFAPLDDRMGCLPDDTTKIQHPGKGNMTFVKQAGNPMTFSDFLCCLSR